MLCLNPVEIVRIDSECADGDACWLVARREDCSISVQLGIQKIQVFEEGARTATDFISRLKAQDRKHKITPELENELKTKFNDLGYGRDVMHEVIDYDS